MSADNATPIFELRGVGKQYNGHTSVLRRLAGKASFTHAVRGVDLVVGRSEVLGIIGESGSGKSTLGYLLANLEDATSGSLLYCGKDVSCMNAADRRQFRKRVQIVFQDSMSSLNPRRLVQSAVLDALRLAGVPRAKRAGCLEELAELVGLASKHLRSYPHELSGGQRQRIGIARALAMRPEVLIADEPVSALDVSLQGQIINLLMSIRRQLGLTVILISHDLAVVRSVSDRVAVMFAGRLVEWGPTGRVTAEPRHPYTRDLVASVPRGIPSARPLPLSFASGSDDIAPPLVGGCPYATRCGLAHEGCREAFPGASYSADGHGVACHRACANDSGESNE
ncbi:MAG: ABC transporter ATP-binding protein [Burkholderiaceae bacterium]|nr:ABC transporter ATP-binding protein [Burkholderiaceae bacterium]